MTTSTLPPTPEQLFYFQLPGDLDRLTETLASAPKPTSLHKGGGLARPPGAGRR